MSEQFIKLHNWMTSELHLTGNELLTFALVHSYTEYQGGYSGGMEPIMQMTGLGRRSAFLILSKLIEKGLVKMTATTKGRYHSAYVSTVNRATHCTDKENEPCNQLHSTVQPIALNRATSCTLLDINRYIDNPPIIPPKGGTAHADAKPIQKRRRRTPRSQNYMQGKKYTEDELRKMGITLGEEFYEDETITSMKEELRIT